MAMNVNDLNSALRGELAAIETYGQALDKLRPEHGNDPRFNQLAQIRDQHDQAAARLKSMIQQHGGSATTDSGAWGTWSNTIMGAARLFGDRSALKALKEGEESGIKDYRRVLDDSTVPGDVRSEVTTLMHMAQRHVHELDQIMDALETA